MSEFEDRVEELPSDPAGTRPKVDTGSLRARRALSATATVAEPDTRIEETQIEPATLGRAREPAEEPEELLPERLASARVPAGGGALPRPQRRGFRVVWAALALVGLAALAGIVAIVLTGTGAVRQKPWSSWEPASHSLGSGTAEIAEHVGPEYQLQAGHQIVIVTGGPLQIAKAGLNGGSLPLQIALARKSGEYALVGGETAMYRLCGLGLECAIATGKPTAQRHLLLRREALELALYTFHYINGVENVVVLMPPPKGQSPGEALFFRKQSLDNELGRPLAKTLPGNPPLPSLIDESPNAPFIDSFTMKHLFRFDLTQANEENSAFLVLQHLPLSGQ